MKKCFCSSKGPKALGPYSTLTLTEDTCYMSGMLGIVPATGKLAEGGIEAQATQAFENIATVLAEVDMTMAAAVKTTVFMKDLNDFGKVNEIYARYFGPDYPARSCVQVAKLPMDALVEVEVILTTK